jgi:hypothetical protein
MIDDDHLLVVLAAGPSAVGRERGELLAPNAAAVLLDTDRSPRAGPSQGLW